MNPRILSLVLLLSPHGALAGGNVNVTSVGFTPINIFTWQAFYQSPTCASAQTAASPLTIKPLGPSLPILAHLSFAHPVPTTPPTAAASLRFMQLGNINTSPLSAPPPVSPNGCFRRPLPESNS